MCSYQIGLLLPTLGPPGREVKKRSQKKKGRIKKMLRKTTKSTRLKSTSIELKMLMTPHEVRRFAMYCILPAP